MTKLLRDASPHFVWMIAVWAVGIPAAFGVPHIAWALIPLIPVGVALLIRDLAHHRRTLAGLKANAEKWKALRHYMEGVADAGGLPPLWTAADFDRLESIDYETVREAVREANSQKEAE